MQPFASFIFVIISLSAFTYTHPYVEKHNLAQNALILQPRQAPKSSSSKSDRYNNQDKPSTFTVWRLDCPQNRAAARLCLKVSRCNKDGKVKSRDSECLDLCTCEPEEAQPSASGGGDDDASEPKERQKKPAKKASREWGGRVVSKKGSSKWHGGQ